MAISRRLWKARDFTPGDNDLWLAATALTSGYMVVTRDQFFSQVSGLQVENWSV
jgi:predicted nucleic acid-binding protein